MYTSTYVYLCILRSFRFEVNSRGGRNSLLLPFHSLHSCFHPCFNLYKCKICISSNFYSNNVFDILYQLKQNHSIIKYWRIMKLNYIFSKGTIHKWRQPLAVRGDQPKGDVTYSKSLFSSKMDDKVKGGIKNLQIWLMSFMDTPKIYTICQIPDKFYTDNLLLLFLPFLPGETPNA